MAAKRARRRKRRQTEMKFRTWGGKRKRAGRKRRLPGPRRVPHRARPRLASRYPVHVTTRIRSEVPRLRNRKRCRVIREAMLAVLDEPGFRICHFSVQRDHLHLICEAKSQAALSRGIKRFKQRVARGINRQLGRKRGSVFFDRFHMEILTNPRQTRNTLVYVLQNGRRHGELIPAFMGGADPFSSAWYFDGWKNDAWRRGVAPPTVERCVSKPGTWLLEEGWRQHGLVGITELPPASRRRCA